MAFICFNTTDKLSFYYFGIFPDGLKFAIKSSIAIPVMAICLAFVPYPDVTPDKLLTALFGGFLSSRDWVGHPWRSRFRWNRDCGVLVSKSSGALKAADVILILNVIIFSTAAFF